MPVPVGVGSTTLTTPSTAALTVGQIADRVTRQFGDEANIQITIEDIVRWINDGQRDLARHNDLLQARATASAVAKQGEYSLPLDILTIRSIRFDGRKLQPMSPQEAEEYIEDATVSGMPERFWVFAKRLNVYPVPEQSAVANISIFYTRTPSVVATATDFPELPAQYHNRLVEYCLKQAYELDENWAAAGIKAQEWEQGVKELKADAEFETRDFYPSITSLPSDEHYGGWH